MQATRGRGSRNPGRRRPQPHLTRGQCLRGPTPHQQGSTFKGAETPKPALLSSGLTVCVELHVLAGGGGNRPTDSGNGAS